METEEYEKYRLEIIKKLTKLVKLNYLRYDPATELFIINAIAPGLTMRVASRTIRICFNGLFLILIEKDRFNYLSKKNHTAKKLENKLFNTISLKSDKAWDDFTKNKFELFLNNNFGE